LKIVITGASGLIGSRIALYFNREHDVTAIVNTGALQELKNLRADLAEPGAAERIFSETKPDVLIHCAALTSAIRCEVERGSCWNMNVDVSESLARECAKSNTKMIHISTDLVFSGEDGDYTEDDRVGPLSIYAATKAAAEKKVADTLPQAVIARLPVVYGNGGGDKKCFARWIADEIGKGREVRLFTDQIRSHFYLGDVPRALEGILDRDCKGMYHVSPGRKESRYEFGIALAGALGLDKNLVKPVKMADVPSPAKRPRDCSLSNKKLLSDTGFSPTPLEESLTAVKTEFTR